MLSTKHSSFPVVGIATNASASQLRVVLDVVKF